MTKAKKAPQKQVKKRDTKWANIIFLVIGVLVALSMVVTSIFTQTQQTAVPAPTPVPAVVSTPAP